MSKLSNEVANNLMHLLSSYLSNGYQ